MLSRAKSFAESTGSSPSVTLIPSAFSGRRYFEGAVTATCETFPVERVTVTIPAVEPSPTTVPEIVPSRTATFSLESIPVVENLYS